MSGWIKLHRSLKDHFLFDFNEPDKALAWIDLLLSANHKEQTVKIKGRSFVVGRGQLCMSQVTLQQRWKMSQNKVKRFLMLLKSEGMIDVQTNDLTTLITICNYDSYQDDERTDERANGRTDERAGGRADERQTRSKELKKISSNEEIITPTEKKPRSTKSKPAELDYSGWPSMPSDQVMQDWLAMRKAIKASVSQTVINTFGAELSLAVQHGFTVDQCLSQCITRNWRGFKFEWIQNAGVRPYANQNHGHFSGNAGQSSGYENPTARIMRRAREAEQQITGEPGRVIEAEFKRS